MDDIEKLVEELAKLAPTDAYLADEIDVEIDDDGIHIKMPVLLLVDED
jgi:hypothetical protein